MQLYIKILDIFKCTTFESLTSTLDSIKKETSEKSFIMLIDSFINSLGSFEDFNRQHGKHTSFRVEKDFNESAKKLIEFCEKKLNEN